jgi:hypothetical protein
MKTVDPDHHLLFRSTLMDHDIISCERMINDGWDDVAVNNNQEIKLNTNVGKIIEFEKILIPKSDENSVFQNVEEIRKSNEYGEILNQPYEILMTLKDLLNQSTANDWFGLET